MDRENTITAERVRILFGRALAGVNTAIAASFIFAYILKDQLTASLLFMWLTYMCAVTVFRYWLIHDYNRQNQTVTCHDKYENRFALLAGLIGIGWAFIIIAGLNLVDFEFRMYSLLLLVIIVALSVPIFSSSVKTIYFYITPPLITSIPLLLSQGETDSVLGVSLIIVTIMVVRSSKDIFNAMNESLNLRYQSQEQAENLARLHQEKSATEKRMQGILDFAPAAIYVKDLDGRFTFLNQMVADLHKMPREEIIGKSLYDILPRDIADHIHENDIEVLRSRKAVKYEESAPQDDGLHHYISTKFPLYDEAGEIYAIAGISTDITEKFQIEESLRLSRQRLMLHREQSPIGVIEWNTDFTFIDWNPAAEKIFGFTKEEVQGLHITQRILPESALEAVNLIWEELLSNTGGTYSLNENITKDGQTILCEWHNTPLVDHNGHVIGVTSLVEDVTERVAADNAQIEQKKAEASSEAKSVFLANMSHEIRTPLNAIQGMANIGFRDSVEAKGKEKFKHILDSCRHLLGVINDILEFSKIEAGKLSSESRPFQLIPAVESSINMVKERAQNKGLKLIAQLPGDLPAWVEGDSMRLQQILLNLLSNAIKFTEKGEIIVSVSRENNMTLFTVSDNGIGLNKEQLSRLFTPFEQADQSTTREFGGTGLGLTISQNLAQLMGGVIDVESQVNTGSCFTLRLPLIESSADNTQEPAAINQPGPRLKGIRVLAAEDVEINRLILEDLLEQEGATVVFAENGQQAIEQLEQIGVDQIDIILMDLQMPVMDGYEATRRILSNTPEIGIIGVTAHALKEERDKCLAAGMLDHVTKPIDPDILISTIRQYINLK